MDQYEMVTIAEYAKLKKLSYWTVRNLIVKGALKATKFGRIYRLSPSAEPIEPEEKYPEVYKGDDFEKMLKSIPIV